MLAVTIVDGQLQVSERPDPQPGAGQILVRVRSAGINNADLAQRRGAYKLPPGVPAEIPGLEVAGEVLACGPAATRFAPGDQVMAVLSGGGQAELVVMHEREAMPVPASLDLGVAGAAPEVITTAHDALFTQAQLGLADRLCVHGAAGGVGTAAVQLGVAAGARVLATVRDAALRARVAALGAVVVEPAETVAHGPYDVILELVGAVNTAANLSALATGGRIAMIAMAGGSSAEVDFRTLLRKRGRIYGSSLRTRPLEQKADAARRVEAHVLPLFGTGQLHIPVHARFDLKDAVAAYDAFAAGGKYGKIVLQVP